MVFGGAELCGSCGAGGPDGGGVGGGGLCALGHWSCLWVGL